MVFERASGILLHITSLPGKFGIGDLGKEAYDFIDLLKHVNQKLWQILPTGPTGYGNSPYQTYSAFAGNPLMIDLEDLVQRGLITQKDLNLDIEFNQNKVEYDKVRKFKNDKLKTAFNNFDITNKNFINFIDTQSWWLNDYAIFMTAKEVYDGKSWTLWDNAIRLHEQQAVQNFCEQYSRRINYYKFSQFIFFEQWSKLKSYANNNGIKIIGDIPIFVSADSADAWANPTIFQFDENNLPTKVAGVPPDYFSKTGQLWGNPLYNWQQLEEQKFSWWVQRFKAAFHQVNIVRVDHFRGFEAYWAVPAGEETAINGDWEKAPGEKLFSTLLEEIGELPIIAEDLGLITKEVKNLRDKFNFPGMKILQFAFDSDLENDYLPHNYKQNCVVYTGTHDNQTTLGWFNSSPAKRKKMIRSYLKKDDFYVCQELLRLAWSSKANTAIVPLQDILCLDDRARMNIPGTAEGNWEWRVEKKMLSADYLEKIKDLTLECNR